MVCQPLVLWHAFVPTAKPKLEITFDLAHDLNYYCKEVLVLTIAAGECREKALRKCNEERKKDRPAS